MGIGITWNPANESPMQQTFLRLVMKNKDRIYRAGGKLTGSHTN